MNLTVKICDSLLLGSKKFNDCSNLWTIPYRSRKMTRRNQTITVMEEFRNFDWSRSELRLTRS